MAAKKWLGLAAVGVAIAGAVTYLVTKAKESPDRAAEMYTTVKEKAKEAPERVAAVYGTTKDKMLRNGDGDESAAEPSEDAEDTAAEEAQS